MSKGFKGSLSSLYHENRARVKEMKTRQLENKARREKETEREDAQKEHPLHYIRLDGRASKLFRNDAAFYAQQQKEGLVPWNGQQDCLIDRYDVRSLLDMYASPDARALRARQKSEQEQELEEMLAFEAYRDLIRLRCLGLSEAQGIRHSQQENVALRAQARAAAEAAVAAAQAAQAAKGGLPSQASLFATAAGTGHYSAVGFSYGTGGGDGGEEQEEEAAAGESESDEDEATPATAEDTDMDRMALRDFHLEEFSSMLRWAMRREAEEMEASRRRTRRVGWGRKKATLRARRLAGQGLDPAAYAKPPPTVVGGGGGGTGAAGGSDLSWIPEVKPAEAAAAAAARFSRDSPDYWEGGRRSRSRSPGGRHAGSSARQPQAEFITSFGSAGSGAGSLPVRQHQSQHQQQAAGGVLEALPGAADPALEGPALLPAEAFKLHGVRPEDRRDRGRTRQASVSGRSYARPQASAAAGAPPRPVDRAKETPQERLKRMMQLQLAKKIQQDSLTDAQRRQRAEEERLAREANLANLGAGEEEQAGWRTTRLRRSRSRSRSRSGSRDRHHRQRSRSRSRERRRRSRSRGRDGEREGGSRRSRSRSRERYRRSASPHHHHRNRR